MTLRRITICLPDTDRTGLGHNNPPPEDKDDIIAALRARIDQLEDDVMELGAKGTVFLMQQRRHLQAPRKRALRKYRQTHKAELARRQREYRWWKAVERQDQARAVGDGVTYDRCERVLQRMRMHRRRQ